MPLKKTAKEKEEEQKVITATISALKNQNKKLPKGLRRSQAQIVAIALTTAGYDKPKKKK